MTYICPLCLDNTAGETCPKDGFSTLESTVWNTRSAEDANIGRTLAGKYRLTERVGAGGMGVVYAGINIELGQWVAVKILQTQRHSSTSELMTRLKARFRREAVLTSRLDHPNVIRTYDFGTEDDDNLFFLVMELVQGLPLDQVLRSEGALSPARTVHILRQIAAGLVEAHQRKVIHRDLKPHNVLLLQKPGLTDFIKLLDFGVATILVEETEMTPLTRPDAVVGSPPFMSPEQAKGEAVDQRTDLYALGVIGYQLLTGRLPFSGNTPVEILIAHLQTPPPPFTEAERARVPEPLTDCIFRLLQKAPGDRYPSATALMSALDALATGEAPPAGPSISESETLIYETGGDPTVTLSPAEPTQETPESASRRGWLVGLVALVLVAGAGYWAWTERAPPPLPLAGVDQPLAAAPDPATLLLFTDRQGHYLAYPEGRGYQGPLYAGSAERLYLQRRIGGSKAGETFSTVFWDPRFSRGADRSLAHKDGVHTLDCGEKEIIFHPVAPAEAAPLLAKSAFFRPRWERRATVLGSDDQGRYFYVDRGRKKGDQNYRLFIGPAGALIVHPILEKLSDREKLVLKTAAGRLVHRWGTKEAEWATDDASAKIDVQDLWLAAPMIYTTLGAYAEPMGTACDAYTPTKSP